MRSGPSKMFESPTASRSSTLWIVPIPGTTKLHRLEENIKAADVELTASDLADIESAASRITIKGARYPEAMERMSNR